MCDSIEKLSTRVNLQLLWVIISGICSFWPFCISFNTQEVPKRFRICDLSLMSDIIKSLVRNYFSVQVCSFWGLLLEKSTICDPFWPLVCPKKDQNLWFVLNEWQYKICDQKCISVQISSIWVSFIEGWTIFDLFAPHWYLGCPKRGQKMWFDKNIWLNQIPHAKLCIYVNFQLLGIILLEIANFDPPFWRPFDPRGLENDVRMENRSG